MRYAEFRSTVNQRRGCDADPEVSYRGSLVGAELEVEFESKLIADRIENDHSGTIVAVAVDASERHEERAGLDSDEWVILGRVDEGTLAT